MVEEARQRRDMATLEVVMDAASVRSFLFYVLFMQVYKHRGNYNLQMGRSALDNTSL